MLQLIGIPMIPDFVQVVMDECLEDNLTTARARNDVFLAFGAKAQAPPKNIQLAMQSTFVT